MILVTLNINANFKPLLSCNPFFEEKNEKKHVCSIYYIVLNKCIFLSIFPVRSIIPKIMQSFISPCGHRKYIYIFGAIAWVLVFDLKDMICLNKKNLLSSFINILSQTWESLMLKNISWLQLAFLNYQIEKYKWPYYSSSCRAVLFHATVFAQWEASQSCFLTDEPA